MMDVSERIEAIEMTQIKIMEMLETLISQRIIKDWYSVEEVAERVGRTPYQVREWLRTKRMLGVKRATGRGRHKEWAVSHEELTHYLNHGLRPLLAVVG